MLDLKHWPRPPRPWLGVFTDIDDTLTTEGAITADALHALAALKQAGLMVIPITGRPMGWSRDFAQNWPVDALVAENGAAAWIPQTNGAPQAIYQQSAAVRAAHRTRLQAVAARILREVPGATLAQDSAGRETDMAIDHSEFTHLPPQAIAQVVQLMRSEGMNATVSSIHINGWFGEHHKLSGAQWIVHQLWGRALDADTARWVYVGDSTNDQVMFEHFACSVGVANIRRFEDQLTHRPRYITPSERGAGFAELTRHLLTHLN
ncbi:HAD-IIB family hydrolase [Limnohabitans sp.]|jgi:HAD superfamily hydrolase (TIGR01484 family)|uniref:HAD-IIB family hydrolase n=1 Tax=Limnohabitans sp. TaxID=1907725 RepID=UPI0037BEBFEB